MLAVRTMRAISGRIATMTSVRRQFMYNSEANRKITVMPSRITTLIASVAAPVTMVTLKVIREIRCPELCLSKYRFGNTSRLLNNWTRKSWTRPRETLARK
ncbi:hypothetical protein D9M72_549560 [compost metagenome]